MRNPHFTYLRNTDLRNCVTFTFSPQLRKIVYYVTMGAKAKTEITESSKKIIDYCARLVSSLPMTKAEFFERSGIRQDYWYKRTRYEAPFTTTDISHIAETAGVSEISIYAGADAMK